MGTGWLPVPTITARGTKQETKRDQLADQKPEVERTENLDPGKPVEYHPVRDPRDGGREGEDENPEDEGFQLHQIQHQLQQPPKRPSYFPSEQYAHLPQRIGESQGLAQQYLLQQQQSQQRNRLGSVRGGGEILEVQGGHIVRSTGRKDRHSKVCTAKGPRDRRVRLSAHTAIQFYDVQDRLGYDRPSKAVDWLIKNAKAAIDELADLPAWHPTNTATAVAAVRSAHSNPQDDLESPGGSGKRHMAVREPAVSVAFDFGAGDSSSTSFLPPSLDSDAIADTIKSFFPVVTATTTAPSSRPMIGYQNYLPDLLSCSSSSSSQDLRLSLQSFQDPIIHRPHEQYQNPTASAQHSLFSGSAGAPLAFGAGWAEQNMRMVPWNVAEMDSGGYMLNVPPPQQAVLVRDQPFTQRESLQSSNSPSIRAWANPMPQSAANHPMQPAFHPSVSPIGFASGSVFSGFHIPAQIQGEEEHDGISDKPSSVSSVSHH